MDPMSQDRRIKRSENREEALQYLMEAVHDRSEVEAVALVDHDGRILAGTGFGHDLVGLALLSRSLLRGEEIADLEPLTGGHDLMARAIASPAGPLCLAALGECVRKMPDAARAIERIFAA